MPPADAPSVRLHEPWILANDRIYWRNGVYDMLFYNGLLLDADAAEVDPKSVVIDDRTVCSRRPVTSSPSKSGSPAGRLNHRQSLPAD